VKLSTLLKPVLWLAAGALFTLGTTAHAQISVAVQNSGFETPVLSAPGSYIGEGAGTSTPGYPMPGWVATVDQIGVQNGLTGGLYGGYGSGLQGSNFGWDDNTAPFYQILSGTGSTIEPGKYTLTVALGTRPGGPTAGAVLSLYTASGSSLGSVITTTGIVGATALGTGTFTDYTLTLNVNSSSPLIGDTLAIVLAGGNLKGNTGIGNDDFDNVRLVYEVPEPSTYAMLLGGLGALFFIGRRRALRA
jgi:hypothetical protein